MPQVPSIITPDTTTLTSTNNVSFRVGPSQVNALTSKTLPVTISAAPVSQTLTLTAIANPNRNAPVALTHNALTAAIPVGDRFYMGGTLVEVASAGTTTSSTVRTPGQTGLEAGFIIGDTGTYITAAVTALANNINGLQVYSWGAATVKIARDHAAGVTSLNILKIVGTLAAATYTYSLYVEATGIMSKIDMGSLQQAIIANVLNFQSGKQVNAGVGKSFGTIKASMTASDSDPTVAYMRNKAEQLTSALRSVGLIIQLPDSSTVVAYGEVTTATPDLSSASGVFAIDFEVAIRTLNNYYPADA
jgi:hypothetical protein